MTFEQMLEESRRPDPEKSRLEKFKKKLGLKSEKLEKLKKLLGIESKKPKTGGGVRMYDPATNCFRAQRVPSPESSRLHAASQAWNSLWD